MFSKFGKLLTYKFNILRQKDEILSPIRPTRSPTKFRRKAKIQELPKTVLDSMDEQSHKEGKPLAINPSSMFRSQSREDFYRTFGSKSSAPPVGYYNCNYNYVSKSPKSTVFKARQKTSSKITPAPDTSDSFIKYSPIKKTPSISFKKQTSRRDILIQEVNENRFVTYNCMPDVCSNYRKVSTPDIGKVRGRDKLIKSPEYCNSYFADSKLVHEDLGKVPEFDKYTNRKPLFEGKEDLRNYDVKWGSIEKKRYAADFSKSCTKIKVVSS